MPEDRTSRSSLRGHEVLKRLLDADRDAKEREEEARDKAQQQVEEAKKQAQSRVDEARKEAKQQAEQVVEEAKRQKRDQGEPASEVPFGTLDAFAQHAEENRQNAIDYIVQWVTNPLES